MAVLGSARLVWVEGAILRNLRGFIGNAVKIRKITASKLQKESLEFCDAEQCRIPRRDSDWEIEADNCGSGLSNLALYPIHEPTVIVNLRGSVRSVAVTL